MNNCSMFLALAQRFFGELPFGNVPDRAVHLHGPSLSIELQPPKAVHPACRPIRRSNDSVLLVEWHSLPNNLVREISSHHRTVVRMDQGSPSLNRALVLLADAEQAVKDIRTCPCSFDDVCPVTAEAGNTLRLRAAIPRLLAAPAQPSCARLRRVRRRTGPQSLPHRF